ncbi:hypothetical protein ABIE62_002760 [Porphyrobacter sp. MBR-155]|jgi:hypothetical protein
MSATTPAQPAKIVGRYTTFQPEAFRLMQDHGADAPPQTACASCPASVWFHQDYWRCFCTVMKGMTWQSDESPIQVCSARESAVVKLELESRKGGSQ